MNLNNNIERIDVSLSRIYNRKKRWLWGVLLTPFILLFAWMFWVANWEEPESGVTLIIHSELDRPILGFSVNGVAGGNASAHGEGATACCGSIKGKTAEVIWTLSMTGPQYEAGIRPEKRKAVVPLPKRKRGENDLHVHFLPNDKVLLGWSDNAWSPYDKRNPKNASSAIKKE